MKKNILIVLVIIAGIGILQAQNDTMYLHLKGGDIVSFPVKNIDSIVFHTSVDIIPETVTDIDSNVYNTVIIGKQVWLKENLKTTKYNDGTAIPLVTDNNTWGTLTTPGYCWHNNDMVTNKELYGALYNWYTVNFTTNGGKNVCPDGWHVPSDGEFAVLSDYLGGASISGGKLKEADTVHWTNPNISADNSSFFTALPAGARYAIGTFRVIGEYCELWSFSEDKDSKGIYWFLQNTIPDFVETSTLKETGFSVRCIRD